MSKASEDGSLPPDPNPSVPPPFVQSLSQLSPGPSSPIPSDFESTTPPLHGQFDHPNWDSNWDVEQPYSDLGYTPPGSDSDAVNEDPPPASSQHIPIPPSITRAYHPKLDGESIFVKYMQILTLPPVGQICDENGEDIPPDTPPPPRDSDNGPDDWTPYNSHLEFEVADFLFC
jgi:hypothetical protein